MVYSLNHAIELMRFIQMQDVCSYEPELFPAVMIKMCGMNFTVFRTGKVIVSGVKRIKAAESVFLPILLNMKLCQK
jgi:TATA-box binding protein (TBP) (component of TFIID and TFIIIB)